MQFLAIFTDTVFNLLNLAIFIRIIMSWIRVNPDTHLFKFFDDITRPILEFARKYIPPLGMIDFSPIVALLALELIRKIIITILLG